MYVSVALWINIKSFILKNEKKMKVSDNSCLMENIVISSGGLKFLIL